MPDPQSARSLLYSALAQNDVDMNNHRLLNLDTSNLPPVGIPPSVTCPPSEWLDGWDAVNQVWSFSHVNFRDLEGNLTSAQMLNITRVGTITAGAWAATPLGPLFVPTLDQIRVPQGNVSLNSNRLTNVSNPVDSNDAVNLGYMDFMLQGLNPKAAVRLATTGQRSLAGLDLPVDGKPLNPGDRILVKNQSIVRDNGIYIASSGSWQRAPDADHGSGDPLVDPGNDINRAYCTVLDGTLNIGTSWVNSTPCVHITDASPGKVFLLFSASGIDNIVPGSGLNRVGNTLNVLGTLNRIHVGATVDIDPAYIGQASITTLGTVAAGDWQADVIAPGFGGTGVSNVGTLTLNNCSLVAVRDGLIPPPTSIVLHCGGPTNVTLPLSGKLATLDGVETFSNKHIAARVEKILSNAQPAINTDNLDAFYITFLSENITSMSANLTGTPSDCQELVLWIKDNGAPPPKLVTWGSAFDASLDMPLPTNLNPNMWLFLRFVYQSEKLKWCLVEKLNNILI